MLCSTPELTALKLASQPVARSAKLCHGVSPDRLAAALLVEFVEQRVVCREFVAGTPINATNIFAREDGVWRMAHHHSSPMVVLAE